MASFKSVQDAMAYVNQQKADYGSGICTIVLVMNNSDYKYNLHNWMDWSGHGYTNENYGGADPQLDPGAATAWLHVHSSGSARGSVAAVQYYKNGEDPSKGEFALAWSTPFSGSNSCYVMTNAQKFTWDQLYDKLNDGTNSSTDGNLSATITSGSTSVCTFTIY
jgi:Nakanori-like protein